MQLELEKLRSCELRFLTAASELHFGKLHKENQNLTRNFVYFAD